MADPDTFGAMLKQFRVAAGYSQESLASHAQLSTRAISDLERGLHRTPHPDTFALIVAALGLTSEQRDRLLALAHAPRSASSSRRAVPLPPNRMLGRDAACAAASAVLSKGQARLLTVTGTGGVGKTRFAVELARALGPAFRDGVVYVECAPLQGASLLPAAVSHALGIHDTAQTSLAQQVVEHIGDRRVLLVLDNLEHIIEGAVFIADLLARCSKLAVLGTSRAPLRLNGEHEWPLAPLALGVACALFRERAEALRPGRTYLDAEVRGICERLDGLPLAIELAASQVKLLTLPELQRRLGDRLTILQQGARDLPPRHTSLELTIRWSEDLLPAEQRRCFHLLGIFVGGWTQEAMRAVCWEDTASTPEQVANVLMALVEASLVQVEQDARVTRYTLLEVVREYTTMGIDAAEVEQGRRRHAAYYAALAAASPPYEESAQRAAELPNARIALAWAEAHADAQVGLALAGFAQVLHRRGQVREAAAWMQRTLALDERVRAAGGRVAPLTLRALHLCGAARIALALGRMEQAERYAAEAVETARLSADQSSLSNAYATVGQVAQGRSYVEQAVEAFAASAEAARGAADSGMQVQALVNLGEIARQSNALDRAATLLQEASELSSHRHNPWEATIIQTLQAHVLSQQGQYAAARALYRDSLSRFHEVASVPFLAWCLEGFAETTEAAGDARLALRCCALAAGLREQAQAPLPPAECATYAATVARATAALAERTVAVEWTRGLAYTTDFDAMPELWRESTVLPSSADGRGEQVSP